MCARCRVCAFADDGQFFRLYIAIVDPLFFAAQVFYYLFCQSDGCAAAGQALGSLYRPYADAWPSVWKPDGARAHPEATFQPTGADMADLIFIAIGVEAFALFASLVHPLGP